MEKITPLEHTGSQCRLMARFEVVTILIEKINFPKYTFGIVLLLSWLEIWRDIYFSLVFVLLKERFKYHLQIL